MPYADPAPPGPFLGKMWFVSSNRLQYGWSNHLYVKGTDRANALSNLQAIVTNILAVCPGDVYVIAASVSDPGTRGDSKVTVYNNTLGEGDWGAGTGGTFTVSGTPLNSLDPDHALLIRFSDAGGGFRNNIYLKGIPQQVWDKFGAYNPGSLTGFTAAMTALTDTLKTSCMMVNKVRGSNPATYTANNINEVADQRIVKRSGGRANYFTVHGRRLLR